MLTDHLRFEPIKGALHLLDQRFLPGTEDWYVADTVESVIEALQVMVIRGAPAIGVTAAYGCVIAVRESAAAPHWQELLTHKLDLLQAARPTAVNLAWAVERMRRIWRDNPQVAPSELEEFWLAEAKAMHARDIQVNQTMGRFGAELLADGDRVMTHCNAGSLATAGWGTALGVIYSAAEAGKKITVVANETRPFLQGARLTAYELAKAGVGVTVACDNACGLLMKKGLVDKVIVGADRIAANGDAANKIGTYSVAVLAKTHGIPFYVAAPASTFDLDTPSGELIPIEERPDAEVTHPAGGPQITPVGVAVYNFAFDVTPAEYISGIITEKGVLRAPYTESIARIIGGV